MPDLGLHAEMLTPLEDPARGWCVPCNLPSTLIWQVVFEVPGVFTMREVAACTECERVEWT